LLEAEILVLRDQLNVLRAVKRLRDRDAIREMVTGAGTGDMTTPLHG
jgi:hypothetical protein